MNELHKAAEAVAGGPLHTLLMDANEIVYGPRRKEYGHPRENHSCTAALWNAYFDRRGLFDKVRRALDEEDVCILNILQKISRHAHSRKRDNLLDIVGWATNAHMVGDYGEPESN